MTAQSGVKQLLRRTARSCGVATSYLNFEQKRIATTLDGALAVINALHGTTLSETAFPEEFEALLKTLRQERIDRVLPPVVIAWDGKVPPIWLWSRGEQDRLSLALAADDNPAQKLRLDCQPLEVIQRTGLGAARVKLEWPHHVAFGYYTLSLEQDGSCLARAMVISAPRRLKSGDRTWGLFAPAYALRSRKECGIGGYAELAEMSRIVGQNDGGFCGTLPLLATWYEGRNANPSPYSPISRLFWNEIYLDLAALPGVDQQPIPAAAKALNDSALVDYPAVYALKKQVLTAASKDYFSRFPDGDDDFRAWRETSPYLEDYARFRAARAEGEDLETVYRLHLYAQYACHKQLCHFRDHDGPDAELYLDYPIGVHGDGFDAHRFSDLFLNSFSVGAPPDLFFSKGQNWGFRPFNPRALLEDRFAYFRATLHHYFRYARMIRLDHIMGLYRLYCVPDGREASDGAYVYYPFDAMMAVLCLEADRHDGVLIGEDLGTVPAAVRKQMDDHGFNRMWIGQFELAEQPEKEFTTIVPEMIAGFNTHDMFPFTAFMKGDDLKELKALGLIDDRERQKIEQQRKALFDRWSTQADPFLVGLKGMAASPVRYVIVNAEDLWQEEKPQNIPGTVDQYPNWRKKFSAPLETWESNQNMKDAVAILNQTRTSHHG